MSVITTTLRKLLGVSLRVKVLKKKFWSSFRCQDWSCWPCIFESLCPLVNILSFIMRHLAVRNYFLQRKNFCFIPCTYLLVYITSFLSRLFLRGFFLTICFWPPLDELFWGNRMKSVGEIQLCYSLKHSLELCCHCIKLFSLYLSAFSSFRDLSAWCVSCGKSLVFHLSVCFSVRWQAYLVFTLVSSSMLCSFCSYILLLLGLF